MSLSTLSAPLRVDWDADWSDAALSRCVAGRVVDAGVFFVSVDGGYLGLPALGLRPLFESAEVTVRLRPADLGHVAIRELGMMPPARVLLEVDGAEEFDTTEAGVAALGYLRIPLGVSIVPARDNVHEIPRVADMARRLGASEIHLPNPNVHDDAARERFLAPLRESDLAAFRAGVAPKLEGWREALAFHVHDLFLWELFHPGGMGAEGRAEYGGCQAAGARAYVAPSGELYACTAMPIPLGNLRTTSLTDLYARTTRARLRAHIERGAKACEGCTLSASCRGGCRGLAMLRDGDFDGRDLLGASLDARLEAT